MTENYLDIISRDPEEVGPEHPNDFDARVRTAQAMHSYEGDGGKCEAWALKFCYEHKTVDDCQSCGLDEYSVLHYTDRHDSECYCNECCM